MTAVPFSKKHNLLRAGLFLLFCLAFFAAVPVAEAAVPQATEHDITVIGVHNQSFVIPVYTTRSEVVAILREHYGTHTPRLSRMTLRLGGRDIRLTEAERNALTPKRINFSRKADAVLLASRQPDNTVNTNEVILQGLSTRGVDRVVEKYRNETRISPRNARYAYNSKSRRLNVRVGKKGRVAPRPEIRRAIRNAMVQYASQGYRGSVTTRNVSRTTVLTSDTHSRRQLGKIILVVRSERRLFLYNRGRVASQYRVAVGRPGRATPRGDFVIGAKRRNPSWSNPGSAWARNMPRTIGPGPNNPLGVRAMNLNRPNGRSTLIRIHGTSNTRSIGTAASAGCIRLTNQNIVKLFNQTPSGTRVWIR